MNSVNVTRAPVAHCATLGSWLCWYMADIDTPIEALRDRLTQLLADWGAEMSMVLKDLEDARARLAGLAGNEGELEALRRRVSGQEELIETLRGDADEAATLRKSLYATELEAEKLRSELESKRDLVTALRKDAGKADKLTTELSRKERELASLRDAREDLERHLADASERLAAAEDSVADSNDDSAELAAARAELAAKASLLETLRADADRCEELEQRLDEKRATIAKLEASLDSQAATIADLKSSASRWKDKYTAAKTGEFANDTSIGTRPNLPIPHMAVDDIDPGAVTITDQVAERTLAINMRNPLREARDTAERGKKDKAAKV